MFCGREIKYIPDTQFVDLNEKPFLEYDRLIVVYMRVGIQ